MKFRRRALSILAVAAFLQSCSSVAPIDSSEENVEAGDSTSDARLPDSPIGVSPDEESFLESQAVTHLLDRAEQAAELNDFSLAEALADRALRIQRTAARAYLVLAMVQLDKGDMPGASDLARQGLLYTPEASSLRNRLLDILRVE